MCTKYLFTYILLLFSLAFTSYEAQTKWYKYAENPVLENSHCGTWDEFCVKVVGYANSLDGISWEKYMGNPVPTRRIVSVWNMQQAIPTLLRIYDILGNLVLDAINGEKSAGYHNFTFDASKLTNEQYFYSIQVGEFVETKKMILLR